MLQTQSKVQMYQAEFTSNEHENSNDDDLHEAAEAALTSTHRTVLGTKTVCNITGINACADNGNCVNTGSCAGAGNCAQAKGASTNTQPPHCGAQCNVRYGTGWTTGVRRAATCIQLLRKQCSLIGRLPATLRMHYQEEKPKVLFCYGWAKARAQQAFRLARRAFNSASGIFR